MIKTTQLKGNELTSIALHDSATNQYWVLVMDKDGILEEKKTDKCIVIPFRDERDMLLKYLELYEHIKPLPTKVRTS